MQGDRVEASQAALLEKLDIRPFSYGLVVRHVYDDGAMYDPAVLDITDEIILLLSLLASRTSLPSALRLTPHPSLPSHTASCWHSRTCWPSLPRPSTPSQRPRP